MKPQRDGRAGEAEDRWNVRVREADDPPLFILDSASLAAVAHHRLSI